MKLISILYFLALMLGLFLIYGCGKEYNNTTPLPMHHACSVSIAEYPGQCFTCRPLAEYRQDKICASEAVECLIQDNQWSCYAR